MLKLVTFTKQELIAKAQFLNLQKELKLDLN